MFAVYEKKDLNEGEWMYQIQDGEVEGTAAMMTLPLDEPPPWCLVPQSIIALPIGIIIRRLPSGSHDL